MKDFQKHFESLSSRKMTRLHSMTFSLLTLFFCVRSQTNFVERENVLEIRLKLLEDKLNYLESSLISCQCLNGSLTLSNGNLMTKTNGNQNQMNKNDTNMILSESLISCQPGWVHFNQSCWQLFDQPLNWSSAKNHCQSMRSHLASIHSQSENDFASTFFIETALSRSLVSSETDEACFLKFSQKMLVGQAEDILLSVSMEKCRSLCISALINCTSFLYYPDLRDCIITSKSHVSQPDLFIDVISDKVDYYEKVPCNINSTRQCQPSYHDIMLIVDGSGSIGPLEFPKIKKFLKLLVDKSDVGANKTQFSMVQFSDYQWSEFSLNAYHSNQEVKEAIDRVIYRQGGTLIGQAIQYVIEKELKSANHGRRSDYALLALILTDGFSQDDPTLDAQRLRNMGATVIAIGVTEAVSKNQLVNIAGSDKRVFLVQDFNSLNTNLTDLINNQLCAEKGAWLGLEDQHIEKIYQWTDGSAPLFFNWADNQPDDKDHTENCVIINENPIGTWNDINCLASKPFLCRMPQSLNQTEQKPDEPLFIIDGFIGQ